MNWIVLAVVLAVANAGVLYSHDTLLQAPISKTIIEGPSGKIVKEDTAPFIARTGAYIAPTRYITPVLPHTVGVYPGTYYQKSFAYGLRPYGYGYRYY
ncbi:hypothetical protein HHI36_001965 [Cryptolaemus montrouzieri]|uniref:Uncharacterized protein n=1 Tax=Cryptolaemus montrouzieri TaxID=559131 RepID=A0ABD2PAG9_9CUCU